MHHPGFAVALVLLAPALVNGTRAPLLPSRAQGHGVDGAALYAEHCSRCHDLGLLRAPSRRVLRDLSPDRIVASLENGTMRTQGAERTPEERRAIAAFLTGKAVGDTPAPAPPRMCSSAPRLTMNGPQWNGWGLSLANDRH